MHNWNIVIKSWRSHFNTIFPISKNFLPDEKKFTIHHTSQFEKWNEKISIAHNIEKIGKHPIFYFLQHIKTLELVFFSKLIIIQLFNNENNNFTTGFDFFFFETLSSWILSMIYYFYFDKNTRNVREVDGVKSRGRNRSTIFAVDRGMKVSVLPTVVIRENSPKRKLIVGFWKKTQESFFFVCEHHKFNLDH